MLAKNGVEVWGTSSQAIWQPISSGGSTIKALTLSAP
jgi:hypothetical protein